ncbi:MAG: TIGR03960 family B12-binding radical SAM protein, partial [Actinomycetota bacterium]|nr:TIGR03960 family B12-binding radical SAM protein [Actinomycetota bacterium]
MNEESLWKKVEDVIGEVQKPSRYIGGEWNAPEIKKKEISVALAYPDIYEIGISSLGLAILQEVVNDTPVASAERVYSPWVDMEEKMRANDIPLFSLETHRPICDFDLFGISLPHELTYTNVLNLIDLAGLPLRASERLRGPIVVGGGCQASNPEPIADFFDLFVLGEGEEPLVELVEIIAKGKREGWSREKILEKASLLPGVYRPSSYQVTYDSSGKIQAIEHGGPGSQTVSKRLADINKWLYPRRQIVPFCEATHDRVNIELFRGCGRGCRFCSAGMIYRPPREREVEKVVELIEELVLGTGYDEVSLCSLSSTDYSQFDRLIDESKELRERLNISFSLPSLRMEPSAVERWLSLGRGRKGSLTFAPEAGSERLRWVINKPIREEEMMEALRKAVVGGRRRIKLYFMIGLPTETSQNVVEIAELVHRMRKFLRQDGFMVPAFNVSVSTFVPKPHTPFQWMAQEKMEDVRAKQEILKRALRGKGIRLSWNDPKSTFVEGLLSRGDRQLCRLVERVWRLGERFDSWSECFDFSKWKSAWEEEEINPFSYVYRERDTAEVLPWDHLDFGLDKSFLVKEYESALKGEIVPDCRIECPECGV